MAEHSDRRNPWTKRRSLWAALILALSVFFIVEAAVVSSHPDTSVSMTSSRANISSQSASSSPTAAPSQPAANSSAHIGSTIDLSDIAVTLNKVIDPASGAGSLTPAVGNRFVAVDVTLKNNGSSSYSDDANSAMSLIASDGQDYTFDPDTVTECTNFDYGMFILAPGDSETGCVVFQVPDTATASKVQFSVSGNTTNTGEWQVP